MSMFCDLALAAGLTLSGTCQPATAVHDPMPTDEPSAWSYKAAEPPPAPAPPPPAPTFPPVIIQKEIIREVPAPAPPSPVPEKSGPDAYEQGVRASYMARSNGGQAWTPIVADSGGSDPQIASMTHMPMPLDMGATIGVPGEKKYKEHGVTSTGPVDNARIVTTDRYISGILETGINTQLDGASGGPVVIQTTRDVFGYHDRNILIPKGSRLVCAFKSLDKIGASRAPLKCTRVLLGGSRAEIFSIKANVTDVQGALGISGEVDNRFVERYGTAFILAGISTAVRAASGGGTTATQSLSNTTQTMSSNGGALSSGSQELSQRLGEITASTLQQTLNLTPILKVAQGTRIQIRPDTDWYIAPQSASPLGETP